MKTTILRIGFTRLLAMLFFGSSSALAFCTEFEVAGIGLNCVDEGHKRVTGFIKPMLRSETWGDIWLGNFAQDDFFGDFRGDPKRHFESCRFATDGEHAGSTDYIRQTYRDAIAKLDPAAPEPFLAANDFGKLLHTVQDFYSHTNWINLLEISAPAPVNPTHLIDDTLTEWRPLTPLSSVQDDIIVGQIPACEEHPNGCLPDNLSVDQDPTSETPVFTTEDGELRGLITGWNGSSVCPDVRAGTVMDEWSHVLGMDQTSGEPILAPRTLRLTHGESEIAGQYDLPLAYQEDRPCHDGYPTYVCLQKDHPGRPDYGQAVHLAEYQTAHEWCRLLHLTKDSYGYSGSSILMTMWTKPGNEATASAPHPVSTPCGTPFGVLTGKPGPIEVTVDPHRVSVNNLPVPDGPPGIRTIFATLYTGDFRRSIRREYEDLTDNNALVAAPMTMCVRPGDKLIASVWGSDDWREPPPEGPHLFAGYRVLRGETLVLDGPDFEEGESEGDEADRDLNANFQVTVGGDDPDGDGLTSACGEPFYGTDPLDADSDDDGLSDGAEVNTYGTDPLDSDSDDDGLSDGAEVNTYGTDPLDSDSDDDGLTDDDEVNEYGTDPNDADTDDDGLPDGIEVRYGTNPLLSDTDGDGLPDGKDVEWIEGVIVGIPSAAIKSPAAGNRNAMLNLLNDAEALLRKGNLRAALDKLTTLRGRIDGCGVVRDRNDWILDCAIQMELRMLVDLLIANVST